MSNPLSEMEQVSVLSPRNAGWPSLAGFAKVYVGAILISAGLLKLHELMLYRGGWGGLGFGDTSVLEAGFVLLELLAGLVFLVGPPQKLLWFTGLVVLASFACYNLFLLADDKPTCGCFGVVLVSPRVSLGADTIGLALLFASLRGTAGRPWREVFSVAGIARPAFYAVIVTAGYSGVQHFLYLSPLGVRVRNETVTVLPESLWAGDVAMGQYHEARIGLRNNLDRPITLVGGTKNCSCYAIKELPATLASGEIRYVPVDVRAPKRKGSFAVRVGFYADLGTMHSISCQVKGRAIEEQRVVLLDSKPQTSVKGE